MDLHFSHSLDLGEDLIVTLQEVSVANNSCNGADVRKMDLSVFTSLKSFVVGDNCFANVEKCFLVGLHTLERVKIGRFSFVKDDYDTDNGIDTNRHFRLSDCESMKELQLDGGSFLDYSVFEIENVPRLETIRFGKGISDYYGCFHWASIELRGDRVFCV